MSLQKAYTESNLHTIANSKWVLDIGKFCTPFARLSLNASSYITVSMSIERLLGNICYKPYLDKTIYMVTLSIKKNLGVSYLNCFISYRPSLSNCKFEVAKAKNMDVPGTCRYNIYGYKFSGDA